MQSDAWITNLDAATSPEQVSISCCRVSHAYRFGSFFVCGCYQLATLLLEIEEQIDMQFLKPPLGVNAQEGQGN